MTINRLIAIPALAAGILGGALGFAGAAAASPGTAGHSATGSHSAPSSHSAAAGTDHTTYAPSVRDENKNATTRHLRQDAK